MYMSICWYLRVLPVLHRPEVVDIVVNTILCTISLAISYVSHLFCAHLCAVPINFNSNDENRILGK